MDLELAAKRTLAATAPPLAAETGAKVHLASPGNSAGARAGSFKVVALTAAGVLLPVVAAACLTLETGSRAGRAP